jgi:REP element-mobilizing transposase RayT
MISRERINQRNQRAFRIISLHYLEDHTHRNWAHPPPGSKVLHTCSVLMKKSLRYLSSELALKFIIILSYYQYLLISTKLRWMDSRYRTSWDKEWYKTYSHKKRLSEWRTDEREFFESISSIS